MRRSAPPPLALEAILIGAVAVAGSLGHRTIALVYLLAAAMGLRTAILTRVGSLTVHTTFVTGMLNKLAQLLSKLAFLTFDEYRGSNRSEERARVGRQALFMFSIWCLYLAGAAAGAWMSLKWSFRALIVPACVVLAALVTDCLHPLRVAQEDDSREP